MTNFPDHSRHLCSTMYYIQKHPVQCCQHFDKIHKYHIVPYVGKLDWKNNQILVTKCSFYCAFEYIAIFSALVQMVILALQFVPSFTVAALFHISRRSAVVSFRLMLLAHYRPNYVALWMFHQQAVPLRPKLILGYEKCSAPPSNAAHF